VLRGLFFLRGLNAVDHGCAADSPHLQGLVAAFAGRRLRRRRGHNAKPRARQETFLERS
jgi:hypothetical protein